MEVHPPHEPIHSFKDFFLHLFTITVGLLIAVGIEGCVELHREHTLVREARETLREEIKHNASEMTEAVASIESQRKSIDNDIKILTKIQEYPKDKAGQHVSIEANFSIKTLAATAWKTAQNTGAFSFMPQDEAQRYSGVYDSQQAFLTQQDKILEDEAQLVGVLTKTDVDHGDLTPEKTSPALERFGIWQAHLVYLDLMAKVSLACDHNFLEGKDCPKNMHEDFGR